MNQSSAFKMNFLRLFPVAFLVVAGSEWMAPVSAAWTSKSSCTVDGWTYEDGASWPSSEGCQQCKCSSGLTFCVRIKTCTAIGQCGVIVTLPGACCPVCFGCVSPSGRKTLLNETWQEDDCTQCVCRDGQSKCTTSFCSTSCLNPRKVSGECCPVCDDDCPLQCHNGRQVDAAGRELCQCRQIASDDFDNFRHTAKANEDIDILSNPSSSGYLALSDNEAIHCPKFHCSRICTHGFQLNQRGCPICKCQRCKSIQDCHKKCTLGLIHDSRGCPTCQCRSPLNSDLVSSTAVSHCKAGNTSYTYGDRWKINDCTSCICHHGGPTCTEIICPLPCPNPIFITGQCCPVCSSHTTPSIHHYPPRNNNEESGVEGQTLLMAVLVCVALVAGLILLVVVLALCVARQCRRLQLHEDNMTAAVKLTAVNRLRPKSTNLDYQYNLYLHRYREPPSNCWSALETDRSDVNEVRDKEEGVNSNYSDSPLLVKTS